MLSNEVLSGAGRKAFAQVAEVSAKRFLDGHLPQREERDTLSTIGRVCLEFACLVEEAIASTGWSQTTAWWLKMPQTTYMERVKNGHGSRIGDSGGVVEGRS